MAKEEKKGGLLETVKTVVYALLIAGVFRTFLFQPFWIPSGSMKDTLLIGDFLFVNKMAYGYSYASCPSIIIPRFGVNVDAQDFCGWADGDNTRLFGGKPQRGDVVVFRHPVSGRDFIKRLVGMPGEQIQMRNGVLHINGQPVELTPDGTFEELAAPQGPQRLRPRCANGTVGDGATCVKEKLIETLPGGVSHSVLNISMQGSDNTPIYTVPEGHYFFMGDNRDNSSDSRVPNIAAGVGFVPYENLIGRADRIMFSSAGRSMLYFWTWRGDRFFHAID
ncbi:signal peptidase I [Mameliella alba]|nr:signal peptidase I [Antarctobacter heliothermus]MBY6143534.1 signal peptidase I [Mameliella alba]MBY6162614.1 signal peptidase I [Mameliella alba]MBY6172361.1 signal peptidase I [Mameliella alba]MBY6176101.1 signal peptidase I [Mameliella alba]